MRDRTVYNEVATLRRRAPLPVISTAALEIHVRAVATSVRTHRPGFVSDAALDTLGPGDVTTLVALELSLAKLWRRVPDGYVVCDLDLVEHLSAGIVWRASERWGHAARAALGRCWRVLNSETVIPL